MYVLVNAAVSADGKLSTRERSPVTLSGPTDCSRVHRLRDDVDAILVGSGTVHADDPRLTARSEELAPGEDASLSNPTRVVVDSTASLPPDATVLDDEAPTIVLVSEAAPSERRTALRDAGTKVFVTGDDQVALDRGLDALADQGIERMLAEGGGEIIASLFATALVDELQTFIAPKIIGGAESPTLADGDGFVDGFPELDLLDVTTVDGGVVLRWSVSYP